MQLKLSEQHRELWNVDAQTPLFSHPLPFRFQDYAAICDANPNRKLDDTVPLGTKESMNSSGSQLKGSGQGADVSYFLLF